MNRRKLIAGNWKMHGTRAGLDEIDAIAAVVPHDAPVEVVIFPPFTLLSRAAGRGLALGAQDCHARPDGAFTGSISAAMVADAGATYVIVGHSERRGLLGETSETVRAKAEAALAHRLVPIVCVGESLAERDSGWAVAAVTAMLEASLPETRDRLVVAYEPVWAVGTGRTPRADEIAEVHGAIKARAGSDLPVLYGGSVKGTNAGELLAIPGVDGLLVGGASLRAADFLPIIAAAQA